MQTLNIANQINVELRKKLADKEHARKSVDSTLESAQDKPRIRGSACVRPMISWLLPRNKWQPLGKNWKKPKGSKIRTKKQKLRQRRQK